jgi:hypothetical protein
MVKLKVAGVTLIEVGLPEFADSQLAPPVTVHETGSEVGFAGALDRATWVVTVKGAVPNGSTCGVIGVMVMVGGLATVRVTVNVAISVPFTPLAVTVPIMAPAARGEIRAGLMVMVSGVTPCVVVDKLGTSHGTLEVIFNVSGVLPVRVSTVANEGGAELT